jgi:hypothetical protein
MPYQTLDEDAWVGLYIVQAKSATTELTEVAIHSA